jgi:predicted deacetylase
MSRFVIRFDDITPTMNWDNFNKLKDILLSLNINSIIGVVPYNLDKKLNINPPVKNFWDTIRLLKNRGWTVAQHGYTHQYTTSNSGLLKINNRSEFSGLSYEQQYNKLKKGKNILVEENIWQPVFMAPAHSFDCNTLKALSHLGFQNITDGYGLYPYPIDKLVALPNLFASPKHIGFGVYTICLHTNNMKKQQIDSIIDFIKKNRRKIISFDEALSIKPPFILVDKPIRYLSSVGLRSSRKIRQLIRI